MFTITDNGVARCFDIHTGREIWTERMKGDYKASPVAAEGEYIFSTRTALCTVVAAGAQFDKLAENQIDDDTIASPAISDGRLYIRGHKGLYCLGRD